MDIDDRPGFLVRSVVQLFRRSVLAVLCGFLCLLAGCVPLLSGGAGAKEVAVQTRPVLLIREVTPQPSQTATPHRSEKPHAAVTPTLLETAVMTVAPAVDVPLTPTATARNVANFFVCSPIQNIPPEDLPRLVSEHYHPPPMGSDDRHQGVDFAYYHWKDRSPIEGTPLQAVLGGRVAAALEDTFPYGGLVILEAPAETLPEKLKETLEIPEGKSLYLLYAHMQKDSLVVALGQEIEPCQVIGAVGKTGNTEAAHLHFETRTGPPGVQFEGMSYFTETATKEEKRNYRRWRLSGDFLHFDPMRLLLYGIEGAERFYAPTSTPKGSEQ